MCCLNTTDGIYFSTNKTVIKIVYETKLKNFIKNRLKNKRFFLKFPLFHFVNDEIQRVGKTQNNIPYNNILNFPTPFSVEFHRS